MGDTEYAEKHLEQYSPYAKKLSEADKFPV